MQRTMRLDFGAGILPPGLCPNCEGSRNGAKAIAANAVLPMISHSAVHYGIGGPQHGGALQGLGLSWFGYRYARSPDGGTG